MTMPTLPWSSKSYWNERFKASDTPWELGTPSVVLMEAFAELASRGFELRGKTVLSPGCGRGSDALECTSRGASVIAVDWSRAATEELQSRYAHVKGSSTGSLQIILGDFFSIPPQPVDLVAEHTFFCAIDPSMRTRYIESIAQWLKPGGFLIGNFFVVPEVERELLPGLSLTKEGQGPPFATTVNELQSLTSKYFIQHSLHQGSQSDSSRRPGIEWVGVFERQGR